MDDPLAEAFILGVRHRFGESVKTIEHCLGQLTDDDVHWRSIESQNSVSTIIIHLCGNVRQWIVSGVGGTADVRDRPSEFTDRTRHSKARLMERLRAAVGEVDGVLASVTASELLETRRIQGFEIGVLAAILDTVAHFVGHAQEITYITRLRCGEDYEFRWAPTTREQGAPE